MQLPDKVQTAIHTMGQYEIAPSSVAPFWYRQYLRFRPETPPPLWGASKGYWDFLALVSALMWGGLATAIVGYVTWVGDQYGDPGRWGLWFLWQGLIWGGSGFVAWADSAEKRTAASREGAVLSLPAWEFFSPAWRPSLDNLRKRTQPSYFWLRTLWTSNITKQAAVAGAIAFAGMAWAFPQKAGSYGEVTALVYMVTCLTGVLRSAKRKPVPEQSVAWHCSQGFWMGSVATSALWHIAVAPALGLPIGKATLGLTIGSVLLHASEWFSFYQQKDLALRAERAEQSRQLAEVRLQMLKNQIEPHFIFNTLAHLKALIRIDPVVAESMADELSDFLRASLQSLREDRMTVAQDIALVRAYLALASLRMGTRLTVDLQMEPATAQLPVPPLMLQTLVENAIQHGIEPKLGPGRIRVSARLDAGSSTPRLVLEVADDGVGFGQAKTGGSGLGLVNIRERLATAFGTQAQLTLGANTPQGVVATLSLPIPATV
ncbi:MAG: hypothetical protein CFE45_01005 [Burkholderiales bacterium PBB5]|nr:MAG: hypothetical protein CFE45_01005 [Burkholderiales bacterium PBB5]